MPKAWIDIQARDGVSGVLAKILRIGIPARMYTAMMIAQRMVANTAKRRYLRGPRPGKLGVVTGNLVHSIRTPRPRVRWYGLEGTVESDASYAGIHEYGGVITPKRSKFLAVPLQEGLGSPREHADTFLIPHNSGEWLVCQRSGGGVTPLYVLKRSVRMSARPFLHPALRDNRAMIMALFAGRLRGMLRDATGSFAGKAA